MELNLPKKYVIDLNRKSFDFIIVSAVGIMNLERQNISFEEALEKLGFCIAFQKLVHGKRSFNTRNYHYMKVEIDLVSINHELRKIILNTICEYGSEYYKDQTLERCWEDLQFTASLSYGGSDGWSGMSGVTSNAKNLLLKVLTDRYKKKYKSLIPRTKNKGCEGLKRIQAYYNQSENEYKEIDSILN